MKLEWEEESEEECKLYECELTFKFYSWQRNEKEALDNLNTTMLLDPKNLDDLLYYSSTVGKVKELEEGVRPEFSPIW